MTDQQGISGKWVAVPLTLFLAGMLYLLWLDSVFEEAFGSEEENLRTDAHARKALSELGFSPPADEGFIRGTIRHSRPFGETSLSVSFTNKGRRTTSQLASLIAPQASRKQPVDVWEGRFEYNGGLLTINSYPDRFTFFWTND